MKNAEKFGLCMAAMVTVVLFCTWLDLWPKPTPTDYPEGSLGRVVASICDPTAPIGARTLTEAITCRDLAAQESMAVSTSRLFWLSWLQVAIGVAGTVALLWSIRTALDSIKITQRGLELQSLAIRQEFRPAFAADPIKVAAHGPNRMRIALTFKNTGNSTAKNVRTALIYTVKPLTPQSIGLNPDHLRFRGIARPVPKLSETGWAFTPSTSDTAGIRAGTHSVQVAFIAIFDDDFGGKYVYFYRREFWGADLGQYRGLGDFEITEPLTKGREF